MGADKTRSQPEPHGLEHLVPLPSATAEKSLFSQNLGLSGLGLSGMGFSNRNDTASMLPGELAASSPYAGAAATNDAYLVETVEIVGRKTELRQLLKLIHLSRQGQLKAVLLTADTGMGKTALIDSFIELVRQSVYSRIIDCRLHHFKTPQHFYVTLIDSLRQDADRLIQEALIAINEELANIGLVWETQDLIRAVSLAQLQDAIHLENGLESGLEKSNTEKSTPAKTSQKSSPPKISSEEQLAKAIKNSLPTMKKLRLSLNTHIDKLVKFILNPWVVLACQLANPIDPRLKTAFALSDEIKDGNRLFDLNYTQDWEAKRPQFFQNTLQNQEQETDSADQHTDSDAEPASALSSNLAKKKARTPKQKDHGPVAEMSAHLQQVFDFINQGIASIDSSLLLLFDHWEGVSDIPQPQQNELKQMLYDLLNETGDNREGGRPGIPQQTRLMLLLGCDTLGQSNSLGGNLFHQFRTKLLLSPLDEAQARKLFRMRFHSAGLEFDENVHLQVYTLTQGNPYWHNRAARYLIERSHANRIRHLDLDFYNRLCIDQPEDLLELSYTRIKLAFLQQEEKLEKAIAALLKTFGGQPFKAGDAISEVYLSQQLGETFVYEVLQRLAQYQFIQPFAKSKSAVTNQTPFADKWFIFQNRIDREFLESKTASVEADLPTEEKLRYLKKIIPLSIQTGELDRAKTQEVLSLCHSLGNTDMPEFLERLFIDSLKSEQPAIRVTALNNLALIDSEKSRQALFTALKDMDTMVREYAAQNLALISQKTTEPDFHKRFVESMLEALDDEYEAIRAQAYQALVKYRWSHDLTAVFIKGLSDADESVRLCSIKFLADDHNPSNDRESPFVQNSLLDAIDDPVPEIRKYACVGLQKYPGPDAIKALIARLHQDSDPAIRALAADSLSFMDEQGAFHALANTLLDPEEDEDVKIAVVRTLGKRPARQAEDAILAAISTQVYPQATRATMPPALLWACVRSLGQIGSTDRALTMLADLQAVGSSEIISSVCQMAIRKIKRRIDEAQPLHLTQYTSPHVIRARFNMDNNEHNNGNDNGSYPAPDLHEESRHQAFEARSVDMPSLDLTGEIQEEATVSRSQNPQDQEQADSPLNEKGYGPRVSRLNYAQFDRRLPPEPDVMIYEDDSPELS